MNENEYLVMSGAGGASDFQKGMDIGKKIGSLDKEVRTWRLVAGLAIALWGSGVLFFLNMINEHLSEIELVLKLKK